MKRESVLFQAARKHHLNLLFPLFRANTSASYPVSRFISRPITVLSKGFAKGFFCIKKETVDKIQQFFFDKWAIEERRYHQLLSILLPGLKNGNLASVEQYLGAKRIEAYAAVPYVAGRWELDDASLPQGAVVVLTCEGVRIAGRPTGWRDIFPPRWPTTAYRVSFCL